MNYDLRFMNYDYQEDLVTPGISPLLANSLKHILQRPNFLIKPCLRPHLKQRLCKREENFGFIFAFASCDVFAIYNDYFFSTFLSSFNGNPNSLNNASPSSLLLALVDMVTSNPKMVFSFSTKISGNEMCSRNPMFIFPRWSIDFGFNP